MTELQLYNFIKETQLEIDWRGEKLVAWLHPSDIDDLCKLIGSDYFSEGRIEARLTYGFVLIDLVPVCEDFGIEPTNIEPGFHSTQKRAEFL